MTHVHAYSGQKVNLEDKKAEVRSEASKRRQVIGAGTGKRKPAPVTLPSVKSFD